jgi:hypothetical protein
MHGILVVEVRNGKKSQENESRENPFLEELEQEIAKFERMSAEVTMRHGVLTHIRNELLKMLGLDKEAEEPDEDEPEKSQVKEKVEKDGPMKHEKSSEKIDVGSEELLSEPMLRRLNVLEQAVKDVVAKLSNADMTGRFKQLGEVYQKLEKCINCPDEQEKTIKHLVEVEAAIGETLNFLSTSKLGARFNLLKELRQELEEAIENSRVMTV